jgi:hypothetical protein
MIYIDEAGTSDREPITVVAAVIVHSDLQYRVLSDYLAYVRRRYRLDAKFIFHAKELFSGGKTFDRDSWPLELRLRIMKRLLSVPRRFRLPIVFGYFRKADGYDANIRHQCAFASCLKRANDYVKDKYRDEMAMVVAENVTHMQNQLSRIPSLFEDLPSALMPEYSRHPYDAIMDQILFAEKKSSPLLQIADHIAFTLRRFMGEQSLGRRLANYMANRPSILKVLESKRNVGSGMGDIDMDVPAIECQPEINHLEQAPWP